MSSQLDRACLAPHTRGSFISSYRPSGSDSDLRRRVLRKIVSSHHSNTTTAATRCLFIRSFSSLWVEMRRNEIKRETERHQTTGIVGHSGRTITELRPHVYLFSAHIPYTPRGTPSSRWIFTPIKVQQLIILFVFQVHPHVYYLTYIFMIKYTQCFGNMCICNSP